MKISISDIRKIKYFKNKVKLIKWFKLEFPNGGNLKEILWAIGNAFKNDVDGINLSYLHWFMDNFSNKKDRDYIYGCGPCLYGFYYSIFYLEKFDCWGAAWGLSEKDAYKNACENRIHYIKTI